MRDGWAAIQWSGGFAEQLNLLNRCEFLSLGLGKFVIGLHLEPETRMRTQRGGKPHGHLSRDASAAVEHLGKRNPRNADVLGEVREVLVFQVAAENTARMRRI